MKISSSFNRGGTRVLPAGKPPKMRFQPGSFVTFKGQLYEVLYAFRLKTAPNEWHYALGERSGLKSRYTMDLSERIVYQLFHSWYEATCHFMWATNESTLSASTKSLLQHGSLVSSGEVQSGVALVPSMGVK
jgi:hypothetical protein